MDRSSCTAHRHGDYSAYRDGCRCVDAREDNFHYRKPQRLGRAEPRRIPVLGYTRMVRALMAIGWSYAEQSRICGVGRSTLEHLACKTWVSRETARKVAKMFADFANVDGPSRGAEGQAWALQYPPPGAWVGRDIHDPDAQPDWIRPDDPDSVAAEQVARGQRRWADLRSEGERLAAYQLAVRGGVSQRSMQTEWKVSSRVITRLNRLENAP